MCESSVVCILFIKQLDQDVDEICYLQDNYDLYKQKWDARKY